MEYQFTPQKPKINSLLLNSKKPGVDESNNNQSSRIPAIEDSQATKSTIAGTKELEYDAMYALIDLDEGSNAKKFNGKVEEKLLQEKIQQRKVNLGLASDEELFNFNSNYASGFNKLVPHHLPIWYYIG